MNQAKGEIGSTASTVPLTLQEALDNIRACHDLSSAMHSSFLIQRSKVWNNVIQEVKSMEFETYRMSVQFIGECAADTGRPTRGLFSLIYNDVMGSKLTRGSVPNLTFSHDQSALLDGEYKIFGQLVALAFLNNASLPHCFSPSVASYILGMDCDALHTSLIEELPADHATIKDKLNSLLSCETPDDWSKALNESEERFDMGINKARFTIQEKEFLIKMANKHIMVSCAAEEIQSFQDGLALFGVIDALKRLPTKLTTEDVRKSFSPRFSLKGSSKRPLEETVIFNFNQFLKQCERGQGQRTYIDISLIECPGNSDIDETKHQVLCLSDVLQFISEARYLPPGGFEGTIKFAHNVKRGQRVAANTCALTLTIPVNDRYCSDNSAVFTSNMGDDRFDSPVFGCV